MYTIEMLYPEELTTFLAVARSGTLSKAALAVHASQSTVSHRLQSLEHRLGYVLIQRSRGVHHISLTSEGRHFLRTAERWEALFREVEQFRVNHVLTLSIGSTDAIDTYIMPRVYNNISDIRSSLRMRIETGTSYDLCDLVLNQHLDVAYVFFARDHEDLDVQHLLSSEMVVIQSSDTGATDRLPNVTTAALLPDTGEVYLPWGPDYDEWHGQTVRKQPFVVAQKASSLVHLMRLPEAWAVVPKLMVQPLQAGTSCTIHELIDPPPARIISRVFNRRSTNIPIRDMLVKIDRWMSGS